MVAKSAPYGYTLLMGGTMDLTFDNLPSTLPQIRAGNAPWR